MNKLKIIIVMLSLLFITACSQYGWEFGREIKGKYCLSSNVDIEYLVDKCEKITTFRDNRYENTYACLYGLKAVNPTQFGYFEIRCNKWGTEEEYLDITNKERICANLFEEIERRNCSEE